VDNCECPGTKQTGEAFDNIGHSRKSSEKIGKLLASARTPSIEEYDVFTDGDWNVIETSWLGRTKKTTFGGDTQMTYIAEVHSSMFNRGETKTTLFAPESKRENRFSTGSRVRTLSGSSVTNGRSRQTSPTNSELYVPEFTADTYEEFENPFYAFIDGSDDTRHPEDVKSHEGDSGFFTEIHLS
jgi:hypothetical protein